MGEIKVKPLEWAEFERGGNSVYANTILGGYSAWDFDGVDGHFKPPGSYGGIRVDGGLTEAKAAAQAHFEARVLSALTPEA